MGDRIAGLKAEIQRIAWTQDPQERDRLRVLKLRLYRLCAGVNASWTDMKKEWEFTPLYPDDLDDLAPYHDLADTLSIEDSF